VFRATPRTVANPREWLDCSGMGLWGEIEDA
jgi:hypothetical protein